MLKSLKIENFRCFRSFELQQLSQLNLLVGTNNSGKTSILEAVQLLSSQPNLEPLPEIMIGRGEYVVNEEQIRGARIIRKRGEIELDIRHLFYEHKIDLETYFSISGNNTESEEKLTVIVKSTDELNIPKILQQEELGNFSLLQCQICGD